MAAFKYQTCRYPLTLTKRVPKRSKSSTTLPASHAGGMLESSLLLHFLSFLLQGSTQKDFVPHKLKITDYRSSISVLLHHRGKQPTMYVAFPHLERVIFICLAPAAGGVLWDRADKGGSGNLNDKSQPSLARPAQLGQLASIRRGLNTSHICLALLCLRSYTRVTIER